MADSERLPATYDIDLVRSDDYVLDVEIEEDGILLDFSTWSNEKLQVRTGPGGELLGEYSTAGGDLSTTSQGRVTATFDDTGEWPHNVHYDMDATDPDGNRRTVLSGTITVQDEITT